MPTAVQVQDQGVQNGKAVTPAAAANMAAVPPATTANGLLGRLILGFTIFGITETPARNACTTRAIDSWPHAKLTVVHD